MLGELIAASCDDPAVLARIAGPIGDAARDAAIDLNEMSADDARTWRARLLAALRSPIPPGIRGVHPSWIETGLEQLPARARTALASGVRDRIDVWLVRWACAELPPLPPIDPTLVVPRTIKEAARLSGDAIVHWLSNIGADQLAHALRSKPDALQAIASTLGTDGDRVIAAIRRTGAPPRAGALGPTRDAILRCRGDAGPNMLLAIGARTLAPHTDALTRLQLAVRLPRPRGLLVRDELRAHANDPIGPAWGALAAY